MNALFIIEAIFIIINLFFLLRTFFKRMNIKKEGKYTIIRNFNSMFFTTAIVAIVFLIYIFIYTKEFTPLTKWLAIFIVIVLLLTSYSNTTILLGHYNFSYMFYNKSYKDVKSVGIANRNNGKVFAFMFKDSSKFSFTISKNNGSTLSEVLKRKSVTVNHIK